MPVSLEETANEKRRIGRASMDPRTALSPDNVPLHSGCVHPMNVDKLTYVSFASNVTHVSFPLRQM
jgi:hypothetical protein